MFQNIPSTLPFQPNSYIDRKEETERIIDILLNPDCHLLTITGQGGAGKTRLAVATLQYLTRQPKRSKEKSWREVLPKQYGRELYYLW